MQPGIIAQNPHTLKDPGRYSKSAETGTPAVADVLLSQMSAWGIRNMYGVAGDAIIPLLDAIRRQSALRYFAVRHENAAALMASAEGKLTARIGVCVGTSGPGLANMLNGIADAAADRVPMLVVTGQVASEQHGTEAKQYVEQQQLIAPLAVYSASLLHPQAATTVTNKAIIEAISKKGVAHLTISKDVLAMPCSLPVRPPTGLLRQTGATNTSGLEQCAKWLNEAQKPVIYIGKGARGAATAIMKLAEKLQAGIIETLGAKGTIPAEFRLHLGGVGEGGTEESTALLKQADCILIVGANWYPDNYVPASTRVIKIDIEPAAMEAQPDIHGGLVGDAAAMVELLNRKVERTDRSAWLNQMQTLRTQMIGRLDEERKAAGQAVTPQALMAALESHIADDGIIAVDTGDHTVWFNRMFRAKRQTVTFSGKWRTMGYALPAAISAKLHHPDKEVTVLAGDGSFLMSATELSTVVKYGLPLKIIVANNAVLGAEQSKMEEEGLIPFGVRLTNPDFALMARSFGIHARKVARTGELSDALREAYQHEAAFLLDVHVTDNPPV